MKYRLNFLQILLVFRNTILWILAFALMALFANNPGNNVDKSLLYFIGVAYIPVMLPLLILFLQYLFYSFKQVELEDVLLHAAGKDMNNNVIIERYQSMKKHKDNVAYLPWMAGTFYYYKIKIENRTYIITCLIDRKRKPLEEKIEEIGYETKVFNEFYPLIR